MMGSLLDSSEVGKEDRMGQAAMEEVRVDN